MEKKSGFKKVFNAFDILVLAFGAMIGWGWVVSSGSWIGAGGVVGSMIGFVIGGIMIFFVGLTYAELTTSMPKCGGEHIFSYKAFGPVGSYICTWALILGYISVVCFEACSLPIIIQYIYPGFLKGYMYTISGFDVYATWLITAVVIAIVVTYINLCGAKVAAFFQTVLTIIIAVVGILLVVASVYSGDISNLDGQMFNNNSGMLSSILHVAVVTPFFFIGFDVVPQVAEEINIPLKKVGRLLVLSICLAVVFYVSVVFAVGLVMNKQAMLNSMNTSGLVTADAMAKAFSSSAMAKVLIIGGMCGIITSWNAFLIGGSRAIYSMAEAHMIPALFAKLNKKGIPVNAIILIGVLSVIAPFFGKSMLTWVVNTGNFGCCLVYCIVSVSFLVLRKKQPDMERPYKVKRYKSVGITAIIMSGFMCVMYLIPGTGTTFSMQEIVIAGGWALLGAIFYIMCKIKYKNLFAVHEETNK